MCPDRTPKEYIMNPSEIVLLIMSFNSQPTAARDVGRHRGPSTLADRQYEPDASVARHGFVDSGPVNVP